MINLEIKTDIERDRILNAPKDKIVLYDAASLSVDNTSIERVELRLYREKLNKEKGFYSLITVYLKSNRGEIELKFDEGFKGIDPLPEISAILVRHVGLESLINRLIIGLDEL